MSKMMLPKGTSYNMVIYYTFALYISFYFYFSMVIILKRLISIMRIATKQLSIQCDLHCLEHAYQEMQIIHDIELLYNACKSRFRHRA